MSEHARPPRLLPCVHVPHMAIDRQSPISCQAITLAPAAQVFHLASQDDTPPQNSAATVCLVIGFYFLLRPGEYLSMPRPSQFCFRNVHFWIGSRALDHASCPDADILAPTFVILTFNRQKNGVRTETVRHGSSGHANICPFRALGLSKAPAPPPGPSSFRPT